MQTFEIKDLDYYRGLYVQHDTLLLSDAFENFEINVLKYIALTLLIFYQHLV